MCPQVQENSVTDVSNSMQLKGSERAEWGRGETDREVTDTGAPLRLWHEKGKCNFVLATLHLTHAWEEEHLQFPRWDHMINPSFIKSSCSIAYAGYGLRTGKRLPP